MKRMDTGKRQLKRDNFHIENIFFCIATFESERVMVQHQKTWNWKRFQGWSD